MVKEEAGGHARRDHRGGVMAGRTREQSDLTSRWNGMGRPVATIEMPTLAIPCSCSCTWTVVRPGPGMACISR